MLMVVMIGLNAQTYSAVTSKTINSFAVYSGLSTIAYGDTAVTQTAYIKSPVFSAGNIISHKSIMVVGTIVVDVKFGSTTVNSVYADLQVSADGTNFSTVSSYKAYASASGAAGTVITAPISLATIAAPYYRVLWRGQWASGVAQTADLWGTINTAIYISPNP